MDFATSIRTCLTTKYATFSGRGSRPEYWWFILAYIIGAIVIGVMGIWILQLVYTLGLLLPTASAGFRRLQDTGKPGWYIFIPVGVGLITTLLTPMATPEVAADGTITSMPGAGAMGIIGILGIVQLILFVLFIWWLSRPSQPGDNAYGPQPSA